MDNYFCNTLCLSFIDHKFDWEIVNSYLILKSLQFSRKFSAFLMSGLPNYSILIFSVFVMHHGSIYSSFDQLGFYLGEYRPELYIYECWWNLKHNIKKNIKNFLYIKNISCYISQIRMKIIIHFPNLCHIGKLHNLYKNTNFVVRNHKNVNTV